MVFRRPDRGRRKYGQRFSSAIRRPTKQWAFFVGHEVADEKTRGLSPSPSQSESPRSRRVPPPSRRSSPRPLPSPPPAPAPPVAADAAPSPPVTAAPGPCRRRRPRPLPLPSPLPSPSASPLGTSAAPPSLPRSGSSPAPQAERPAAHGPQSPVPSSRPPPRSATPTRRWRPTATPGWQSPTTAGGSRFEHGIKWPRRAHPPATSTSAFPRHCSLLHTSEGAPTRSKELHKNRLQITEKPKHRRKPKVTGEELSIPTQQDHH
ncbi:hypothetical protein U9M48_009099 [Paspalum notatum var. saurae]|uniref:Uncharacterized protein n=1 Tax=Paspalum notatum var. saurae TaxID=547442 RepID=A0AAQ3SQH3_PASNO